MIFGIYDGNYWSNLRLRKGTLRIFVIYIWRLQTETFVKGFWHYLSVSSQKSFLQFIFIDSGNFYFPSETGFPDIYQDLSQRFSYILLKFQASGWKTLSSNQILNFSKDISTDPWNLFWKHWTQLNSVRFSDSQTFWKMGWLIDFACGSRDFRSIWVKNFKLRDFLKV